MSYDWKPYVSVAERRRQAEREMAKLRKKGHAHAPVTIQGRKLGATFWGKAWCDNLESYSDYANRLPRGRTYVRNGSVVDLQVSGGEIRARVMGSELYTVTVKVAPIPTARWNAICKDCSGSIDSLVELLQGRLSKAVMERVCQQKSGLFPAPAEIALACSCPDWASMCKHVAAVLYGIGARLDEQPELAFKLRAADHTELIVSATMGRTLSTKTPVSAKVLDADDLSALFGLEMEGAQPEASAKASTKVSTKASVKVPSRPAAKKKPTQPDRSPVKTSSAKLASPAALPKAPKAKAPATNAGKRKAGGIGL
jgi:uncharacterized Zn finger protein